MSTEDLRFFFAVLSAAGGSGFIHGFHISFLNVLSRVIMTWYVQLREDRSSDLDGFYSLLVMTSFMAASFSIGAIFGSCLIYSCAQFLGRKVTLLLNNFIVLLSIVLLSFAQVSLSYEIFIVGRMMMGIAAGLSSGITPMYLIEISPDCIRGAVGTFYYVMIALSAATASLFSLPSVLGNEESWPVMFVLSMVPSLFQIISLVFCPESPKYLLFDKEDEEEAEEALAWLRGSNIDFEMEELRDEAAVLTEVGQVSFLRLLVDQTFRSPLIICTVIMFGQQACGINGMLYFSVFLLSQWGHDTKKAIDLTIGLGMCNFIASVVSLLLVDKIGRKTLFLGSYGGMIFSKASVLLLVLLTTFVEEMPREVRYTSTAFLFAYVFAFGLGAGPTSWFITAEMSNHFARPLAITIVVTINWVIHAFVVMFFMPLTILISQKFVLLVFIVFDIFVLIFILMTLRETKDLSSIDIIELFYD